MAGTQRICELLEKVRARVYPRILSFRTSPIARTPEVKAQPPPLPLPPPLFDEHTNDLSPSIAPRPPAPLPSLPPQTTHFDKDERYMATSDLCTELKKDVKIDAQLERRCV